MENQRYSDRDLDAFETEGLEVNSVEILDLFDDAQNKASPAQADNSWQVEKSDSKSGVDSLKIKMVQQVTLAQFIADNPQIDPNSPDKDKTYNYRTYQSQLDTGWRIEPGSGGKDMVVLSKDMHLTVNHRNEHTGSIETVKKISGEFLKQCESKINEIPKGVRKVLEEAGYKVLLAPTVIEGLPALKGQSYRGWSQDFSYVDGTQDAEKRLIILGEKCKGDNDLVENARVNQPGHQFGHAFDAVGKKLKGMYFSSTKEFLKVYNDDLENMTEQDKSAKKDKNGDFTISGYLSQPNGAGARETFASIFGMLTNGPENPGDDKEIKRLFPRTISYLRDTLLPQYAN